MKSLLLASVVLFSTGVVAQSVADAPNRNTESQNRLVGAWKLVSLEEATLKFKTLTVLCVLIGILLRIEM